MKRGDFVYYDRYGMRWDVNSPSQDPGDYGVGILVSEPKIEVAWDQEFDTFDVMQEDGVIRTFSVSYLKLID